MRNVPIITILLLAQNSTGICGFADSPDQLVMPCLRNGMFLTAHRVVLVTSTDRQSAFRPVSVLLYDT
jgi:hypothetical protein